MLKRILFITLCLLLAAGPSLAQESPFKGMFDTAVGYFTPVTGNVKSVEEGIVLSDINSSSGAIRGMRLSIFRQGKTFLHPITREPLGRTESEVGRAELLEAAAEGSRLRIIAGEAREGDILRRSSAPVQVLFYQSSNMDWDVSEEYYFQLKNIKAFDILDAAPGSATDEEIAAEAGRRGAEVAIALTADHPPGKMVITQRLIWANDAAELSSEQLTIEEENLKSYKVGEELFAPKKNVPLLTFKIPYSTELVAVGDVDGDGEKELVLSTGHDVMFYSIGLSLNTALEGVEIDGPVTEEHIWLETHDLDGDGKDEVVLSSLNTFSAVSYVYRFSKGSFSGRRTCS
jgi:hypothetical protein